MSGDSDQRRISDADVDAIAKALAETLEKRFYQDLGKGVWAWVWKAVITSLVAIAAYGSVKGWK